MKKEATNYKKIMFLESQYKDLLLELSDMVKRGEIEANSTHSIKFINLSLETASLALSIAFYYERATTKIFNYLKEAILYTIICLEKSFSTKVLLTPKELIENKSILSSLNPREKYFIIQRLGYLLNMASIIFKKDTKTFMFLEDLYLRFIVLVKNMIDFKNISDYMDISNQYYRVFDKHSNKAIALLDSASSMLRIRYEKSGIQNYFIDALNHLEALRVISYYLGKKDLSDKYKKTYEIWLKKFQIDIKTKRH